MNKDKKQYKKDIKRHRKELVNIAKNTFPWEYADSFDFIVEHLKMMKDYYDVGYNVWGEEEYVSEIKEIIDKMLFEYAAFVKLPRDEREEIAKELEVEVDKVEDNSIPHYEKQPVTFGNKTVMCTAVSFEDKYYPSELAFKYYDKVSKAEELHFDRFVDLLKRDFRKLCD